jgi:hypothetical protein
MNFAGFLGYLMGSMIDPLTWGPAAFAAFAFHRSHFGFRLILIVVANVSLNVLFFYAFSAWKYGPFNPQIVLFSTFGCLIWFLLFAAIRRIFSGRSKDAPNREPVWSATSYPGLPLRDEGAESQDAAPSGGQTPAAEHQRAEAIPTPTGDVNAASESANTKTPPEAGNTEGPTTLGEFSQNANRYRHAAAQGSPDAQQALGTMYLNGDGVLQDYVLAHMWFNLSAAQGNGLASVGRDSVSSRMTAEQIAEAQKLARDWIAANPK